MTTFRGARRYALFAAAALALAAGIVGCGGGESEEADATTAAAGKTAEATAPGGPMTIIMTDNKFDPNEFTIPVNTEVEITVDNQGAAIHNMHIMSEAAEGEDFASENIVRPGTSNTFTVKFTKSGTYDFICDFHPTDMTGTLTVE